MIHKFGKVLAIFMCMVLLVGCSSFGNGKNPDVEEEIPTQEVVEEKPTPVASKLLTIGMQNPITLHPIYNMDKSIQQNMYLLFDTLVKINEDGSISPNVAQNFVYSEADKCMRIDLRQDVKWHDGTDLTAEDVAYTLEVIQKASESPYKLSGQNIANIQVVDRYTVKIYYRQAFSGAYQTLFFPVIPKHIYTGTQAEQKDLLPIGSGPYKYAESVSHKEITLVANDNYFKGKPQIETIKVMIIPDEESLLYAFEQGLIDVIYTDVMDWGKYAKDKSANIYELGTSCYEFMGLNHNKPIFQNANIRSALVYALDRQKMSDVYYLGHSVVTDTLIAPHSYLFDPTMQIKSYDLEKAKLLLVGEGYTYDEETKLFVKNNIPLGFTLLVNQENKERVKVAESIKKMYQEVGIEVTVEKMDALTFKERIYNKQFEAFLGGWK
ncbi:MAG: peptide ABC transporter substrate-binding protein, partial [Niameybacter sp.]